LDTGAVFTFSAFSLGAFDVGATFSFSSRIRWRVNRRISWADDIKRRLSNIG
jgi:hypothetical protein